MRWSALQKSLVFLVNLNKLLYSEKSGFFKDNYIYIFSHEELSFLGGVNIIFLQQRIATFFQKQIIEFKNPKMQRGMRWEADEEITVWTVTKRCRISSSTSKREKSELEEEYNKRRNAIKGDKTTCKKQKADIMACI